jgi:hypothetical protein
VRRERLYVAPDHHADWCRGDHGGGFCLDHLLQSIDPSLRGLLERLQTLAEYVYPLWPTQAQTALAARTVIHGLAKARDARERAAREQEDPRQPIVWDGRWDVVCCVTCSAPSQPIWHRVDWFWDQPTCKPVES